MRVGIGISAGSEVVCATLVVVEDDGSRTVEYRTVSADAEANTDIGDLVTSAIDLMVSLSPSPRDARPITVAYRTAHQASSIRSACARAKRHVTLVPESEAAYAFLDDSGLIARYRSVAVVDIGARGTTTSIIDVESGVLQTDHRTELFGGDVMNNLVKDLIVASSTRGKAAGEDSLGDRGFATARHRAMKEHLSTHDTAAVSGANQPTTIDRVAFEELARPYASSAAQSARRTAASAPMAPEAVVLIGGGANVPLARIEFGTALAVPVIDVTEPDTVLAKGAAHLASNATTDGYSAIGSDSETHGRSMGRFSGALVGAFIVGGMVLAYGIQTLSPTADPNVSPAGSNAPSDVDNDQVETVGGLPVDVATKTAQPGFQPSTAATELPTNSTSQPQPSLHPAPDLSVVPWPAEPLDLGGPDPATARADGSPTTLPPATIPPATLPPDTLPLITLPPPILLTTLPPAPMTGWTVPPLPTPPWTTPPDGAAAAPPTDTPDQLSSEPPPATGEPAGVPKDPTVTVPEPTPSAPPEDVETPSPALTPPATVWSPPQDPTADAAAAEVPRPSSTSPSSAPPSTTSPITPGE